MTIYKRKVVAILLSVISCFGMAMYFVGVYIGNDIMAIACALIPICAFPFLIKLAYDAAKDD